MNRLRRWWLRRQLDAEVRQALDELVAEGQLERWPDGTYHLPGVHDG